MQAAATLVHEDVLKVDLKRWSADARAQGEWIEDRCFCWGGLKIGAGAGDALQGQHGQVLPGPMRTSAPPFSASHPLNSWAPPPCRTVQARRARWSWQTSPST